MSAKKPLWIATYQSYNKQCRCGHIPQYKHFNKISREYFCSYCPNYKYYLDSCLPYEQECMLINYTKDKIPGFNVSHNLCGPYALPETCCYCDSIPLVYYTFINDINHSYCSDTYCYECALSSGLSKKNNKVIEKTLFDKVIYSTFD